jgi:hypothetical protein
MLTIDEIRPGPIGTAIADAAGLSSPDWVLPAATMTGIGLIWVRMIRELAGLGDGRLDAAIAELVRAALGAVGASTSARKTASLMAAQLAVAFPFPEVPAAIAVEAMLNGVRTLRVGTVCVTRPPSGGVTAVHLLRLTAELVPLLPMLPSPPEISLVTRALSTS